MDATHRPIDRDDDYDEDLGDARGVRVPSAAPRSATDGTTPTPTTAAAAPKTAVTDTSPAATAATPPPLLQRSSQLASVQDGDARLTRLLRRREDEARALRRRLAASEATTTRLWRLVGDLEARAAAATSLASRETCDPDGVEPLCAAVRSEPQQRLPARVRSRTSDLRMRRLWGSPADDPNASQRYLLVLTVGAKQKDNVDRIVRAFDPDAFTVVLFHYDGGGEGVWGAGFGASGLGRTAGVTMSYYEPLRLFFFK